MEAMRSMTFYVQTDDNETVVTIVDTHDEEYDNDGAVYYVVVIVHIYGFPLLY